MGKSTTSKQTNEPPAWAKPLLTKAASEGMRLYDAGVGYNVYDGPTQAPLSDATLGGMNKLLAATGYTGAPVSNEGINSLIPDIRPMIEQAAQRNAQVQAAQGKPSSLDLDRFIPAWVKGGLQSDNPLLKHGAQRWMDANYNNPNLTPMQWNVEQPGSRGMMDGR
ncbi:MAG TPA: hypothetical protein VNS34_04235 [Rhizobiaceae bacterium]|nr:hypothetical protein [Rhizobiaceae bacterium]